MTRGLMSLAIVGLFASVAACGGSRPEEAAPFHGLAADSVFVSGTARCTFDPDFNADCTLDVSDPRVSGSERQANWRIIMEGGEPHGSLWVADTCSLTNAGGSWHGSAQATDVTDSGTLLEAHYVGEGAYQGLEFHYYLSGLIEADVPVLHGWISGGG